MKYNATAEKQRFSINSTDVFKNTCSHMDINHTIYFDESLWLKITTFLITTP